MAVFGLSLAEIKQIMEGKMPQFKNQKFKVPNATVGRLLQEKLIAEGYRWELNGDKVREDITAPYFYTYSYGKITYGSLESFFSKHENEEMLVVTESRLAIAELKPRRDKVIVFGRTYYKDDVDRALAHLEIVQP
jgi:hypothetical protein